MATLENMIDKYKYYLVAAGVFYIFLIVRFGFRGFMFGLLIFALFLAPMLIILNRLEFSTTEKILCSIFLSLSVVPTLTFYLGIFLGSLTRGIVVTAILLYGVGYSLRWAPISENKAEDGLRDNNQEQH